MSDELTTVFDGPGMPLSGVRHSAVNLLNERIYKRTYNLKEVDQCYCGNDEFRQLSRYDRYGLPFGTKICISCGLITLDRMLSDADWASFYNDIYWPLIFGTSVPSFQTHQDDFSDFEDFLKPHINTDVKVVMEVGCGSGIRLELIKNMLVDDSVRLVGADYSESALEIAKSRGVEVLHGSTEVLKSIGKADLLIMSHVFEHMPDLEQALDDISELTHENSKIYVEVPGVVDLENKIEYEYDYQQYCVLAHIHNFSLATLTGIFRTAGFGLIQGNDYVRSIFGKNVITSQQVNDRPYEQIIDAIQRARRKSVISHDSVIRRMKRILSAVKKEFFKE